MILIQFFTWNQQTGGCGIRTWTPGNYVIAFGQRFGTKTIVVDAENTVPVGKAFPRSTAEACKSACLQDFQCKSWTWSSNAAQFNKEICALNYGNPSEALNVGNNSGIISGVKNC